MGSATGRLKQVFTPTRKSVSPPQAKPSQETNPGDTVSISKAPAPSKPTLGHRLGLALCFSAALAGAAMVPFPAQAAPLSTFQQVQQIDNKAEAALVEQSGQCGEIVDLAPGQDGKGIHLSVHGLGASPAAMKPLDDQAAGKGMATSTFAYDDMHCTQEENAANLADSMSQWVAKNPGENITIETHSMGGRIALTALDMMNKRGDFPAADIDLNMVSPALGGYGPLNVSLVAPIALLKLIPGAAPTHDMASFSNAQENLEQVKLPSNVETTIYYGTNDSLIDYRKDSHDTIEQNLNAEVYYIAGAEHGDTVPAVAAKSKDQLSAEELPYEAAPKPARRVGPPHRRHFR